MNLLSGTIEDYPEYYDIIFGNPRFAPGQFNVGVECTFLDEIFRQHAVTSILELACGPAYHAVHLAKMGYTSAGLDISVAMLKFAEKRAQKEGVSITWHHQDMRKFQLTKKYDAIICVLDSLRLLTTVKEILSHLESVASNLTEKGIFVTEWSHPKDWFSKRTVEDSWVEERNGITIEAKVRSEITDFENQITTDTLEYTITNGEPCKIVDVDKKRLILPQEFLLLAGMATFELVSFYGAYDKTVDLNHAEAWRTIAVLQKG